MLERPPSDPAAIGELAARLRVAADRIDDNARRLDARLDDMTFGGPAALRLRAAMAERRLRAGRIADGLRETADFVRVHGGQHGSGTS